MKLIKVTDIKWDCDDEEEMADLPKELIAAVSNAQYEENEDDDGATLGDLLSDFYGWCHFGFEYERYTGGPCLPDVDLSEY